MSMNNPQTLQCALCHALYRTLAAGMGHTDLISPQGSEPKLQPLEGCERNYSHQQFTLQETVVLAFTQSISKSATYFACPSQYRGPPTFVCSFTCRDESLGRQEKISHARFEYSQLWGTLLCPSRQWSCAPRQLGWAKVKALSLVKQNKSSSKPANKEAQHHHNCIVA